MLAKAKNDHANIKTTFFMNLLLEKKYGIPSRNFVKKKWWFPLLKDLKICVTQVAVIHNR
jgi:hypothetical protein